MKVRIVGKIIKDYFDSYVFDLPGFAKTLNRYTVKRLCPTYTPDLAEPLKCKEYIHGYQQVWCFRDCVVAVDGADTFPEDEVKLKVKHAVLKDQKAFSRMAHEVKAFENMSLLPSARRERIPDAVRLFVWQRDEGKCVKCGNSEKLEFDHIIPVVKGGANTERNLQLLCESCNRGKGSTI